MNQKFASALAIIIVSTILGGLFGSFITLNYIDKLPWSTNATWQKVLNRQKELIKIEEQSAVIDVVNKVSPAVVSVVIKKEIGQDSANFDIFNWPFSLPDNSDQPSGPQKVGGGSGFIITPDGYIITNRHVVDDSGATYSILTNDGKEYAAKVIAKDTINDFGVLKIEANDLPTVEFGDSDNLVIGQSVVAIGNALAEFSNTVTVGVVSGKGRNVIAGSEFGNSERLEDVLQTDAAINPGNSGGPLLNLAGQVIGINTAISSQGQLIGFAIPINSVKKLIDDVISTGEIQRAFLGVRYRLLTKDIAQANQLEISEGALIVKGDNSNSSAITTGSPADKAGLREGDVIVEIDGQKIDVDHDLAKNISRHKPGDTIKIKVWRSGKITEMSIVLEKYKL